MPKPHVILDATQPRVEPAAVRSACAGLIERLGAELAAMDGEVAALTARTIADGNLPIVLGNTCEVALGAARSVAGRGRMGLAYIDGHADFQHDANLIPLHKRARCELALLTGRTASGAMLPDCFRDTDTATIGFKRDDEAFFELRKTEILLWPMYWLYEHPRIDLEQSLKRRFDRAELDGIWIHLDLDAIDPRLLPGVATPIDDGLSVSELVPILRTILATGKVIGMSIANLTPELLADGVQAKVVADALTRAFDPQSETDEI